VLCGVNLTIHRGEMVAIVGGSGSGKSVLLGHLYGHHRPDTGHVLVADHAAPGAPLVDLTAMSEDELDRVRIHWAVVFQHNALFSGTVYDNIALWLREIKRMTDDQIRPIARKVAEAVGLTPDDVLDRHRDDLSGGMAKRVAVARALAMDPLLMFYDEPTTGLDPHYAATIQDLIGKTHASRTAGGQARTTIIVTHDKDLLRRLRPRVVMLHEGKVFFDGSFAQFEASTSPIIRPYFDLMPVLQHRVQAAG
jgi:phospholipid/cholesterol/gamma-HCH transport system ATP-binding protein